MTKLQVRFEGGTRFRIRHEGSAAEIPTAAPEEGRQPEGTIAPTDLVAAALGSCMATAMAIVARRHGVDLAGMTVEVRKEMTAEPEPRVGRLSVAFALPRSVAEEKREALRRAALACKVHKALSPDVRVETTFDFSLGG